MAFTHATQDFGEIMTAKLSCTERVVFDFACRVASCWLVSSLVYVVDFAKTNLHTPLLKLPEKYFLPSSTGPILPLIYVGSELLFSKTRVYIIILISASYLLFTHRCCSPVNRKTVVYRAQPAKKAQKARKKTAIDKDSNQKAMMPHGLDIVFELMKTIDHFFPSLWETFLALPDPRLRSQYSIAAIVLGTISLFLFKAESRNGMNIINRHSGFARNFKKIFGFQLPHMDTAHAVMDKLEESALEQLKATLVRELIEKKVFQKLKLFNGAIQIAIDGTKTHSFDKHHCDECLSSTWISYVVTKTGFAQFQSEHPDLAPFLDTLVGQTFRSTKALEKSMKSLLEAKYTEDVMEQFCSYFTKKSTTSYFHAVLEAKIVCANGFSISVATEWISNTAESYEKQDCELNAFKRLAPKLKRYFPKMNICIIADGLYPNSPFFDICRKYQWDFVAAFKQGSLPSIRQEINALLPTHEDQGFQRSTQISRDIFDDQYTWIANLDYKGQALTWVQCVEEKSHITKPDVTKTRFEYVTNIELSDQTRVIDIVRVGRMRQKIENEGFNIQKNHGHGLTHQYSRSSVNALKNYYQCLQLAHLFEQLCFLARHMRNAIDRWKITLKYCFADMVAALKYADVDLNLLQEIKATRVQFRY